MSGNNNGFGFRGRSNTCITTQSLGSSDNGVTTKVANINDRKSFTLKKCHSDDNIFSSNKKTIYFIDVITQAINNTKAKQLTLSDIYDWIEKHKLKENKENQYYFDNNWKNLIIKTLSSYTWFSCTPNKNFKTSLWSINSNVKLENVTRKRRATSMEKEEYDDNPGRAKRRAQMLEEETSEIFEDISERINTSATLNEVSDELNLIVKYPQIQNRRITYNSIVQQTNTLLTDNLKIERMSNIFIQMQKEHSRAKRNVKNIICCTSSLISASQIPPPLPNDLVLPCVTNLIEKVNSNEEYVLEYCFRTEKYGLLPTSYYKIISNIGHQVKLYHKENVPNLFESGTYDYHYNALKEKSRILSLQESSMSTQHICEWYRMHSLNTDKSLIKK